MVRVKLRYLIVEIIPAAGKRLQIATNTSQLYSIIKQAILETHGDFGLASVRLYLNVKYVNPYTNIAIVRTKRGSQNMVSTALSFIRLITGVTVTMRTLHVGGTVRSCQKFLARYHLRQLPQLLQDCKTPAEKATVQKAILGYSAVRAYSFNRSEEILEKETEDMEIFDTQ